MNVKTSTGKLNNVATFNMKDHLNLEEEAAHGRSKREVYILSNLTNGFSHQSHSFSSPLVSHFIISERKFPNQIRYAMMFVGERTNLA